VQRDAHAANCALQSDVAMLTIQLGKAERLNPAEGERKLKAARLETEANAAAARREAAAAELRAKLDAERRQRSELEAQLAELHRQGIDSFTVSQLQAALAEATARLEEARDEGCDRCLSMQSRCEQLQSALQHAAVEINRQKAKAQELQTALIQEGEQLHAERTKAAARLEGAAGNDECGRCEQLQSELEHAAVEISRQKAIAQVRLSLLPLSAPLSSLDNSHGTQPVWRVASR
jgi:DNA repair exonuclease SbcCD ATPase subunit